MSTEELRDLVRQQWEMALALATATTLARGNPVGTRHGLVSAGCIAVEDAIREKLAELSR